MPTINQQQQPSSGGGLRAESPEEKAGWRLLRAWLREQGVAPGETFTVRGTITKIILDGQADAPRYWSKKQRNDKGEEKDWYFVKAATAITDPHFGKPGLLSFPHKNVGAAFFDGRNHDGSRSNLRGGMYNVHLACTGQEPGEKLVAGNGDWNTEDYENRPLLLRIAFEGLVEEGSRYVGTKADLTLFVNGFEKDPDVHKVKAAAFWGERPEANGASAPAPAAQQAIENARVDQTVATERQVRFLYAIGREAEMDEDAVNDWSLELYSREVEELTRRDISTLIDAMQRRRNELVDTRARQAAAGTVTATAEPKKPTNPDDDVDF